MWSKNELIINKQQLTAIEAISDHPLSYDSAHRSSTSTVPTSTAMLSGKMVEGSYTMQHVVMTVAEEGPAHEAGLRQGDLITHINGESIQGRLNGTRFWNGD